MSRTTVIFHHASQMKSNQLQVLNKSNPLNACSNLCVTSLLSGFAFLTSPYTSPGTYRLQIKLIQLVRAPLCYQLELPGPGWLLVCERGLPSHAAKPSSPCRQQHLKLDLNNSHYWVVATGEPVLTPTRDKLTPSWVLGCPSAKRVHTIKHSFEIFCTFFIWTSCCWTWDFLTEPTDVLYCSASAVISVTCIEGVSKRRS